MTANKGLGAHLFASVFVAYLIQTPQELEAILFTLPILSLLPCAFITFDPSRLENACTAESQISYHP